MKQITSGSSEDHRELLRHIQSALQHHSTFWWRDAQKWGETSPLTAGLSLKHAFVLWEWCPGRYPLIPVLVTFRSVATLFSPNLSRSAVFIKWCVPGSFPSQPHCSRETNQLSWDSKAVPEGITHRLLFRHTSRRLSTLYQLMRPVDPVRTLQSSGQHKSKGEHRHKACLFCRGSMLISHLYLFKNKPGKLAFLLRGMSWFVLLHARTYISVDQFGFFYSNRTFPSIVSFQHVPPSMHHWEESPRGQTECCWPRGSDCKVVPATFRSHLTSSLCLFVSSLSCQFSCLVQEWRTGSVITELRDPASLSG